MFCEIIFIYKYPESQIQLTELFWYKRLSPQNRTVDPVQLLDGELTEVKIRQNNQKCSESFQNKTLFCTDLTLMILLKNSDFLNGLLYWVFLPVYIKIVKCFIYFLLVLFTSGLWTLLVLMSCWASPLCSLLKPDEGSYRILCGFCMDALAPLTTHDPLRPVFPSLSPQLVCSGENWEDLLRPPSVTEYNYRVLLL